MKKTAKKLLTIAATVIMLCVISVVASAETYGDLTYTVSNGEVKIVVCKTTATEVEIPAEINGYPVTVIDSCAFFECSVLTSVTIPDSVTSIGEHAFYGCTSLESVYIESVESWLNISFDYNSSNPLHGVADLYLNGELLTELIIPDGVTSIGDEFRGCTSITSVIIPDSVKSIETYAFSKCTSLESVKIPSSVEIVETYAFYNCTALANVEISNGVKTIKNSSFANCSSLNSITIPASIESIGSSAFNKCTNILSYDVDLNNPYYTSKNGVLFSKDMKTLVKYPSGKETVEYAALTSVENIGEYSFADNKKITEIVIPENILKIDDYAFNGCINLVNINLPDKIIDVNKRSFAGCGYYNDNDNWYAGGFYIDNYLIATKYGTLTEEMFVEETVDFEVKPGTIYVGNDLFGSPILSVTIPESVVYIADEAFMCDIGNFDYAGGFPPNYLKEIKVDENNQYYSSDEYGVLFNKDKTKLIKFPGGSSMSRYDIPETVTELSDYSFYYSDLNVVAIPDNVVSIGSYAFYRNTKLQSISVGKGVKSIGEMAFPVSAIDMNSTMQSVTVDENNEYYSSDENGLLFNKDKTTLVYYPAGKGNVCTIPDGVVTLGKYSLGKASYSKIYISNNVKNISDNVLPYSDHSYWDIWYGTGYVNVYFYGVADEWNEIDIAESNSVWMKYTNVYFVCKDGNAHEYTATVTAPTCTEQGYTTYTCSGCNRSYNEFADLPTGHNYYWNDSSPATCTEPGFIEYSCVDCYDTYTETIEALGHSYSASYTVDTPATCTTAGSKSQHCTRTGCTAKRNVTAIPATGHTYNAGTITTSATCTSNGVRAFKCTVCTATKTETVAALGHKFSVTYTIDTPATCTTVGSKSQHCTRIKCAAKTNVTSIPALSHNYEAIYSQSATCEESGYIEYFCDACSSYYTEITEQAKGHTDIIKNAIPANCTSMGYTGDTYCIDCDSKLLDGTLISATGHTCDSGSVLIEATCCTKGIKTYNCTVCETIAKIEMLEEDMGNHTGGTTVKDSISATCTENGYTGDTYCNSCYTELSVGSIIEPIGHTDKNEDDICDDCNCNFEPDCSHECHSNNTFSKFFWRIMMFFNKLFNIESKRYCDCGVAHW